MPSIDTDGQVFLFFFLVYLSLSICGSSPITIPPLGNSVGPEVPPKSQGVLTETRIKHHSESDLMGIYVARVKSQ